MTAAEASLDLARLALEDAADRCALAAGAFRARPTWEAAAAVAYAERLFRAAERSVAACEARATEAAAAAAMDAALDAAFADARALRRAA